jgi:hypothetical protein
MDNFSGLLLQIRGNADCLISGRHKPLQITSVRRASSLAAFLQKVRRRISFEHRSLLKRYRRLKVWLKDLRLRCFSCVLAAIRKSLFRIASIHARYRNKLARSQSEMDRRTSALDRYFEIICEPLRQWLCHLEYIRSGLASKRGRYILSCRSGTIKSTRMT